MLVSKQPMRSFHHTIDRNVSIPRRSSGRKMVRRYIVKERSLKYRFYLHGHPYVRELINALLKKSIKGLQEQDNMYQGTLPNGQPKPLHYQDFFKGAYEPNEDMVEQPFPVKELDFSSSGAYSVYNWELFYHIPLTIAIHLSKNQRFEEAQRWFHFIFDPTDDSDAPSQQRFWKVKPFQQSDIHLIEETLLSLSLADSDLKDNTISSINNWSDNPFRPHVIARYRHSAYMFKAVMAYLDNLIAWGDTLFRQDTRETINEATQLYVLASNILGIRPQEVPKRGSTQPLTYASRRGKWDEFANVLEDLETEIGFDIAPHPAKSSGDSSMVSLRSIGRTFYFCIPRNDKLLTYWDTVADRLYKIHNSLNIQGIFRKLALFAPPIDPALLARAAAAGLDIGAVISGLNQPLPLVRFRLLVQKATEIVQEVKSLGNNLLSAIEKKDNEALALIRAQHEHTLLKMTESVRYAQWQEAIKNREGLEQSLTNAKQRYVYYERLLGKSEDEIEIPELEAIDTKGLDDQKFSNDEPAVENRAVDVDIFEPDIPLIGDAIGGLKMNTAEGIALSLQALAIPIDIAAVVLDAVAAATSPIPKVRAHVQPLGPGASVESGGQDVSRTLGMLSGVMKGGSAVMKSTAGISSTVGSYQRRKQDWSFQSNLAAGEINQIYKQLVAAEIREYITEKEWRNHQQQIKNAETITQFLEGEKVNNHQKISTQGFYAWMKREVRGLYNDYFQFAFDTAKKAERALQHELGKPALNYIQFGYRAGKEGLLAGEKLLLDVKRMDLAYFDQNQREYELTKHISIQRLNPLALIQLKTTGKCTIQLPEELFDMDNPGHYFRRIKTVAVSIPCVVGPYTSINCTLTLTKSTIRKSANLLDGAYARQNGESERFSDNYSSLQSVVTSTGQNDSGLFETNLNDERYLPFEYVGAVSEWQLALPNDFRQFDYKTITDVILHLRYTAREGGRLLQRAATENIATQIETAGSTRLFNIKQEFPMAWHQFKTAGNNLLQLEIKSVHYPYWSQGKVNNTQQITLIGQSSQVSIKIGDAAANFDLAKNTQYGENIITGNWENIALPDPTGMIDIPFNSNDLEELWLILTWL